MSFCDDDIVSNSSENLSFERIVDARFGRRSMLGGTAGAALVGFLGAPVLLAGTAGASTSPGGVTTTARRATRSPLGFFSGVAMNALDNVTVPDGFIVDVVTRWGDPINGTSPAFRQDASNTTADQTAQLGMHHDGIHYFPLPKGSDESGMGLLVMNHEYTDDGLLHVGGTAPWTADKVAKSQAAHGVSVVKVERSSKRSPFRIVKSRKARRITASTPTVMSGPAAGHRLLQTAADPTGRNVLGTFNNCAHGFTPWGTYLTCEENFNGYFVNGGTIPADQKRYGISAAGSGYRWNEFDTRFDAAANPNEPNRFGWVVEIDPYDPTSTPVKRTALGRVKHEGAWVTESCDGHAVVYMGDDERFEYIYKFVSARPWRRMRREGVSPLDEGTLYVARFDADGSGVWLPLIHGSPGLDAAGGFADQGDVLIRARSAADALGATKMDRPEWITSTCDTATIYASLTNNSKRGTSGSPAVDAANPRAVNSYGQVIRWDETDEDTGSLTFAWNLFILAGDTAQADPAKRGTVQGDSFGSPDGLWMDPIGRLWIQTDVSTSTLGAGDFTNLPNNQMLVADTATGETKRFLVGPRGCEITGIDMTPDRRVLFVNIQHPGEPASERTDPVNPTAVSSWPDGGRPRSSTVAIRRVDNKPI